MEVGDGVGGRLSQDTSVLVREARARPERESCADRNNKPKMAAGQNSRITLRITPLRLTGVNSCETPQAGREVALGPSGLLGQDFDS